MTPFPATKNSFRYTYESNSHIPILKLYIFTNKPSSSSSIFTNPKPALLFDKSLVQLTWIDNNNHLPVTVFAPLPKVLIDADAAVNVRVSDDCVEVKFVLLVPVDHPVALASFEFDEEDEFTPLQLDSDLKKLANCQEVHFYCRGCSTKLTKAVRTFKEMPSVNWREAADNWFGTCCCSFGGVSEKLVAKYANLYTCSPGTCLLDGTSVVLCKDDLVGYKFPDQVESHDPKSLQLSADNDLGKDLLDNGISQAVNVDHNSQNKAVHDFDIKLNCSSPEDGDLTSKLDTEGTTKCPPDVRNNLKDDGNECCHTHDVEETLDSSELLANKASIINGLLGNSFMVTSPYLSKDIKWSEILCPNCSCLLGAYPHDNIDDPFNGFNTSAPLNDGVHLFKCFISTCLPVGGPTDLFRKYTLERMFTSQLLESAKDELSFRTVVRNLQTRDPMLQIVLLNPNSWCSFGDCMDAMVPTLKINLYPAIKVLFSDCSNSTESQLRKLDQWVTENQVDDVYMLMSKALAETLEEAKSMLPSSHACLQGLSLSFLRRH